MGQVAVNLVPSLTRWGLTPDADLLFRTLTMYGPKDAAALARDLDMTLTRVDRALSALHDARVAAPSVRRSGQHLRWRAHDVAQVVATLRDRKPTAMLHRLEPTPPMAPFAASADVVNLGDGLRHLPNRHAARNRLAQLVAVARHTHMSFNPETSFEVSTLRSAAPMDKTLQSRGVQIRVIGVAPGVSDLLCPYGGVPKQLLLTYRQARAVPMKLIVVDHRVALFPVDPSDHDRGYLEVSQAPIVESLAATFERHWASAQDVAESLMPTFELSPREQAVVSLLILGHTDATAARQLRISERSVSNILRSIMDRLGVENRFQLGVALGALRAAPLPPGLTLPANEKGTQTS